MPFFQKKPVVIEAKHFTGDNGQEIVDWAYKKVGCIHAENPISFVNPEPDYGVRGPYLRIRTLEGIIFASMGDWIIEGIKGEFYPCKPDIFEETYQPLSGVSA